MSECFQSRNLPEDILQTSINSAITRFLVAVTWRKDIIRHSVMNGQSCNSMIIDVNIGMIFESQTRIRSLFWSRPHRYNMCFLDTFREFDFFWVEPFGIDPQAKLKGAVGKCASDIVITSEVPFYKKECNGN